MIEHESSEETPKFTPNQHDSPFTLIQPEQPPKATYLTNSSDTFLSKKELNDRALCIKLRAEGITKIPGLPFEGSDQKEFDQFSERGVFEFIKYDPNGTHKNIRLFKSRMVREVKGKNENSFEKSRFVIAGHSHADKSYIPTQSQTIQRVSQRLLIAIAAFLQESTRLELRDIS
ncbi:hypothetical protein EV44_g3713 [Erysiphe necator]|uniref:Uncharacterized protein n=1 Tax=Uncinula necator TaxID=52586 RepID=A0A0B1PAC1_UNCNE|nr:hypothetical protein EV44_g3713 [Erysiphe necator]